MVEPTLLKESLVTVDVLAVEHPVPKAMRAINFNFAAGNPQQFTQIQKRVRKMLDDVITQRKAESLISEGQMLHIAEHKVFDSFRVDCSVPGIRCAMPNIFQVEVTIHVTFRVISTPSIQTVK